VGEALVPPAFALVSGAAVLRRRPSRISDSRRDAALRRDEGPAADCFFAITAFAFFFSSDMLERRPAGLRSGRWIGVGGVIELGTLALSRLIERPEARRPRMVVLTSSSARPKLLQNKK
jgi:hypothetical protein